MIRPIVQHSRPRRGMTLLEVAISAGISVVVAATAIAMMIYVARSTIYYRDLVATNHDVRMVSDTISRDIRHALQVDNEWDGFKTGPQTLILRIPSIDADQEIIDIESKFDRIVYTANGRVLVREVFPGDDSARPADRRVIGSIVDGITWEGAFASQPNVLGAEVIHFQFTTSRGRVTSRLSGSARLRNKVVL